MYHVMYSEKGDMTSVWKKFSTEKQFRFAKLVVYSNYKELINKGITTAMFAHDTDSNSLKLKVYFRSKVTPKFDLFCYTDNNSRLFDRKIKAFDSYDINNNDIEVYYEKGKAPIRVKDFKNRYIE